MITLFGWAHFFNFVSFLLYPTDVKRLKCAMLGAFTVIELLLAFIVKSRSRVKVIYHRYICSIFENGFLEASRCEISKL